LFERPRGGERFDCSELNKMAGEFPRNPFSSAAAAPLVDPFGRAIVYLRVSVTDRCDFRCVYCMSKDMKFCRNATFCRQKNSTVSAPRHRAGRPQAAYHRPDMRFRNWNYYNFNIGLARL
jgi:hypothetical protein